MAQKKKGKGRPVRRSAAWQGKRESIPAWVLVLIVLVGLAAVGAGYFVQANALLTVDTDRQAVEENTVYLNEVMSENVSALISESGDVPDWIEITNAGSEAVQLSKYSLLLDTAFNRMYTFPDYMLQPGEYLLLYAVGDAGTGAEWELPFKLSASGGQNLILMNPNSKAVDSVQLPELEGDQAYCREGDQWIVGRATPGRENAAARGEGQDSGIQVIPGALEFTEVMASNTLYFADENGEHHDYVEIHNCSAEDVNLEGWYLSDSSDDLKGWSFPAVVLPANAYLAVHCSGLDRVQNPNHLHTNFKIGSEGECIYLSQPDGQTVAVLETGARLTDQALSLISGEWSVEIGATPGMENTADAAGRNLESTFASRSGVYISEIAASPTEQEYDWIELHNASTQAIDLSDYGLSDNSRKPRKWQFPAGTVIQPGQYMGVYLSGQAAATLDGFINADFALASDGGYTVTLAQPDGRVVDAAYLTQQYGGITCGRAAGEDGFFLFEAATPGAANSGSHYRGRAPQARASVAGGVFTSGESFSVELSAPAGYRIYYTLDCTDPDQNSNLYTGPIQVSGTTILRSCVYKDGYAPSYIDTQSYLYDVNNEGAVYVVSVVSDPDNLFSNERGIMVKGPNAWSEYPYGETNEGANFWMDWEREGHVEVFEPDGDPAISQGCGLKLHGQFSRAVSVKAFKVIARKEYGSNRFAYPIFSERDYPEYQSFLLRASGQDYNMTFMRDSVLSALAKDTSVMYQETEIGVCYLNGEYYSLFNLRERVNKHSICQFEDWVGMEDDIDLIKANNIEMQGSNETFEELLDWVKNHDMTTQEAYDYLDSKIDIQNYIEYMAIENYVGNTDTLNVKRYRNALDDGKWRWVIFDLDWGFYVDTNSLSRWLTPGGMGSGGRTDNSLFIACMKNPIFAEKFITHLGEQMATTFSSENVMRLFMERYDQIDGLLPAYCRKWNIDAQKMQEEMQNLFSYIETRPVKMLGYIQKAMKFSDAQMEQYFGDAIEAARAYKENKGK